MFRKIISGICAVSLVTGTVSFPEVSAEKTVFIEYEGYDVNAFESLLSEFEREYSKPRNDENVKNCILRFSEEMAKMETQIAIAYIDYCCEMSTENANKYVYIKNTYSTVAERIVQALITAGNSGYEDVVSVFLEQDTIPEYDEELIAREQEFISKKAELETKYTNIAYSTELTDSGKNYECAKIYLELVKECNDFAKTCLGYDNYLTYAYESYGRDYGIEDVIGISDEAKDMMKIYHNDVYGKYNTVRQSDTVSRVFENNFEKIRDYCDEISPGVAESADWICENEMYTIGENGSMAVSFTSLMPQYDTPYIYQYEYNVVSDFFTAVHEFGHFNAARNSIPENWYEIDGTNLDIAEVHSQGMEVIFTHFYDRIFDTSSNACRYAQLADMISAVAAGFMVNEFEYYVFSNYSDEMTADDVVKKYNEIKDEYEIYDINMYRISHIFQTPGYYISYAVSALAALELWGVMADDFDKAVQMYTDFSHCSYLSNDYKFKSSLESCGFSNIFADRYISTTLAGYVENITDESVRGDIDKNGTVTAVDMRLLAKQLVSVQDDVDEETMKLYDVNRDGVLDVLDALKLKGMLI